jgi:hypothetical protein
MTKMAPPMCSHFSHLFLTVYVVCYMYVWNKNVNSEYDVLSGCHDVGIKEPFLMNLKYKFLPDLSIVSNTDHML